MYVLYMGLKGWLENKTYSQMTVIPKENSYINTHTHTHTHTRLPHRGPTSNFFNGEKKEKTVTGFSYL